MAQEHARIQIGEKLRSDAVADWHRATLGGRDYTLRILRVGAPSNPGAPTEAAHEHARLLFEEEIRRIARLDHPALLRVHRISRKPPRPWMLTDPIGGPSLEEHVASAGPFAPRDAVAFARTLLSAFGYLHARKQVHAAPLPSRIVRVGESWRLLTFRDVRAWDELKNLKGRQQGTPALLAPEQGRESPESLRPHPFLAWSLGVLLRFVAGGGPARGQNGSPAPLPTGFPVELAPLVEGLLAEDPGARPQGLTSLEAWLSGKPSAPGGDERPQRPALRAPIPRKRRPRG